EVFAGDGAVRGAQHHWRTYLGIGHAFFVGAAVGGAEIGDALDERNGRLQAADGVRAAVADRAAAPAVACGLDADYVATVAVGAVAGQPARNLAVNAVAETAGAGGVVKGVDLVVGSVRREVLDLGPGDIAVAVAFIDGDDAVDTGGQGEDGKVG